MPRFSTTPHFHPHDLTKPPIQSVASGRWKTALLSACALLTLPLPACKPGGAGGKSQANEPAPKPGSRATGDQTMKTRPAAAGRTEPTSRPKAPESPARNAAGAPPLVLKGSPITKHRFDAQLEGFGKVTMVPTEDTSDGPGKLRLYLVSGGKPIYLFPDPKGITWSFDSLDDVTFDDLDGDGRKDLLVVASYMTGAGRGGAEPFPVGFVFFRSGAVFQEDKGLAEAFSLSSLRIRSLTDLKRAAKRYLRRHPHARPAAKP